VQKNYYLCAGFWAISYWRWDMAIGDWQWDIGDWGEENEGTKTIINHKNN